MLELEDKLFLIDLFKSFAKSLNANEKEVDNYFNTLDTYNSNLQKIEYQKASILDLTKQRDEARNLANIMRSRLQTQAQAINFPWEK